MSDEFDINDTESVVQISSDISCSCEECDFYIDADVEEGVNHYIQVHGYTLLHIGQETEHDQNGEPWHNTVAFLAV
ncbi:hypothetical protein [Neptunomonas concharum]|uniref:Uncharacterized protein n=1 Tax=Neptunomonas concharum TaxID=1031538 RepID=A0A5P1R9G8_9GAMM|nr:hypothetical protein [Neptunomonas concharum]QEQ96270.1 hypothetical protein F0U83_05860 [Neptunomonas concharum]